MIFPPGRTTRCPGGMKTIRRSEERGYADHGWLNAHHTKGVKPAQVLVFDLN